jgi:hypothetical protein
MTPTEIQSAAIRLANIREMRNGVVAEYMRREADLLLDVPYNERLDVLIAMRAILDANRGEQKDYPSKVVGDE